MVLAEVLAPLVFWMGLERFGDSGRAVGVLQGMMVAVTARGGLSLVKVPSLSLI